MSLSGMSMTEAQMQLSRARRQVESINTDFCDKNTAKYLKGQQEHGGDLLKDFTVDQALGALEEESLDAVNYHAALRAAVERERTGWREKVAKLLQRNDFQAETIRVQQAALDGSASSAVLKAALDVERLKLKSCQDDFDTLVKLAQGHKAAADAAREQAERLRRDLRRSREEHERQQSRVARFRVALQKARDFLGKLRLDQGGSWEAYIAAVRALEE